MIAKTLTKYLLIFLGTLSLTVGIVGIFIPVLPTTPFLLLTSYLYMRSSRRLYEWLIHHRVFGAYIYNYITYRAVTKRTKISALIFLWLMLLTSILFMSNLHIRICLIAVGIGVSIHLFTLKVLKKEEIRRF